MGRYKGRVKYWEICNEPNNWKLPEVYVTMAKTAYVVGKQADPECRLGAFASFVELPFFDFCLKAGMADYFDFVTIHPYQWSHSFNDRLLINDIDSLERLLKQYHCNRPIWISEIGWPTHPKGGSPVNVQGDIIAQLYLTAAGLEKYKTFLYTLGDWGGDPTDAEPYFGMFDSERPAEARLLQLLHYLQTPVAGPEPGRAKLPEGLLGWRYLLPDGRLALSAWRETGNPVAVRIALPGIKGSRIEKYTMDLRRETSRPAATPWSWP